MTSRSTTRSSANASVILSRTAPKLLSTVGGQKHATAKEHDPERRSKRFERDVDLTADPLSSSDGEQRHSADIKPTSFVSGTRTNVQDTARNRSSAKRKSDDENDTFFGEGHQSKRPRSSYSRKHEFQNIHAQTQNGLITPNSTSSQECKQEKKGGFRMPALIKQNDAPKSGKSKAKTMKIYGKTTTRSDPQPQTRSLKSYPNTIQDAPLKAGPVKSLKLPPNLNLPAKQPKSAKQFKVPQSSAQASDASSPLSSLPALSPPSSPLRSPLADHGFHADDAIPLHHDEEPELENTCPICREPVDPVVLASHGGTSIARLAVRKQMAFCRAHKRRTAEATYRERGYPSIEWAQLRSRLSKHLPHLQAILNGQATSFYRQQLQDRINAGEKRTLAAASDEIMASLTPGYYGARGARVMMEFVLSQLAPRIRTLAGSDRLVASAGGVSRYVQSVLVPELATRLVMQDMDVSEVRAMQVLEESGEIGELVNEDLDEATQMPLPQLAVDYPEGEEDDL
ncbi:hypothetical protein LTS18_001225 [Coniosporium uncinatum]|uniref:Uncharacterized protein n=1 Tax=Coniosporium uncinatum TaxID=93489 RepID=A0ACC3DUV4_9PEZI|nr:hypothetical protein LTS18_001225 [Coniosporium uncinatum]